MKTLKNISNVIANNELRFNLQRNWTVEFNGLSFIATCNGKKMMEYNDEKSTLKVAKELAS